MGIPDGHLRVIFDRSTVDSHSSETWSYLFGILTLLGAPALAAAGVRTR